MIELMLGDCLKLMNRIEDRSVDMVLCDLPYGTTACKWDSVIPFEPLWSHYNRVIKPEGVIVLFAAQPFTSALVMSNPKAFKHEWVWDKVLKTGHLNAKKAPMPRTESIVVFGQGKIPYFPQMEKGQPQHAEGKRTKKPAGAYGGQSTTYVEKAGNDEKYPSNVVVFQKVHPSKTVHPTQKPVALLEYLIQTYSKKGQIVLDNTMGSGSTGVACVNTGRDFIGIEMDSTYFEIAEARIYDAELEKLI